MKSDKQRFMFGQRESKGGADVALGKVYGCPTGKNGYVSKKAAKRALKDARRKGWRQMAAVYDCGLCPGWHLTSQEQRTF